MTAAIGMRKPSGRKGGVLIFGGAGFVGSAITRAFVASGWSAHVVDSLEPDTFADPSRLDGLGTACTFERCRIEEVAASPGRLDAFALIVDAAGWTQHAAGEADPVRDLELNLAAHLPLLATLDASSPPLLLLGSLHQFGAALGPIDDDTPFSPLDAQSIHKCALEHHARRVSRKTGAPIIALRFGNCIGPGQPAGSGDVGLVGGFIRALSEGHRIEVYEGPRRRSLCFTPDLGAVAVALAAQKIAGFSPINVPGLFVTIADLAEQLARLIGGGTVARTALPAELARREVGSGPFLGARLAERLPDFAPTPLDAALAATVSGLRRGPHP